MFFRDFFDFFVNPDAAPRLAAHRAVIIGVGGGGFHLFAGLDVDFPGSFGVDGLREVAFPVEVCPCATEVVVTVSGGFYTSRDVCGVSGDS